MVDMSRIGQIKATIGDFLVVCAFPPYTLPMEADLLAAVTGWDTGLAELMKVAERVITTARLFNIKQGFTDADDVLPERFYQPKTDGVLSDKPLDRSVMEKAKRTYYFLMGWDEKGVPRPEKVEQLYIE